MPNNKDSQLTCPDHPRPDGMPLAAKPAVFDLQNQRTRKVLFAAVAFVLQGCWALYVNLPFGWHLALQAALLHGAVSAAQTLVSAMVMEFFFSVVRASWLKLLLPVVGTMLVMLLLVGGVHVLNHTPDIPRTILSLLVFGLPYYAFYTGLLWHAARRAANPDRLA